MDRGNSSPAPAFLRTLARAQTETAAEEWEEAARLWGEVVAQNPIQGNFWARLAEAHHHAQQYRQAIEAYERVLELGTLAEDVSPFPFDAAFQIARCHAELGEIEETLRWLARAFDLGYRDIEGAGKDDSFQKLHDDPRFREIVSLVDVEGMSREEGWQADLSLFARHIKRQAFAPFGHVAEDELEARINALQEAVPRLTDVRIAVEMMRILCLLGDGHAFVEDPDPHSELSRTVPVQFYLFEEGLYIIAANPAYRKLLGGRVLRLGERPVDEILRGLLPILSRDNAQWPKHAAPVMMCRLPILHALDLVPDPDEVSATVVDLGGQTISVTFATEANDAPRRGFPPYPEGWQFFPRTPQSPLPLYLKNLDAPYWFEYLPDSRLVYFQFNSVRDHPQENLADFSRRLFHFIDDHVVDTLVIDVRWNSGGNTFLEMPLLHRIIGCEKINRRGQLFVIVGRKTFSAAQNGATMIERHTEAIFVGEPTGSSPNFVGETIPIELPFSKLRVNVSDLYWQSSWPMDHRPWIGPTLYTPPTFEAYRHNRDPAIEAILASSEHMPGW